MISWRSILSSESFLAPLIQWNRSQKTVHRLAEEILTFNYSGSFEIPAA